MDFYGVEEETPLLQSIHVRGATEDELAASPKEGSVASEPSSPARLARTYQSTASSGTAATSLSSSLSSAAGWRRRVLQAPEFQLSVDNVAFLFSPKRSGGANGGASGDAGLAYGSDTRAGGGGGFDDDELAILDPYFDVTDSRLQAAFEEAGPDGSDELSYEAFRSALETMGIRCTDDAAFLKLVRSIDRDARRRISFGQFDAAVHKLKLVHLFDETTVRRMVPPGYEPAAVTVSDFSRARLQQFALAEPGMSTFFTAKRPQWVSVRWINVVGRDSLTLKRLAIKYRLHPLAIEDTLEMHERPKFDRYDNHLFLVFPVLRMEVFGDDPDGGALRTGGLARARSFTQSMSTALVKQLERHTSFRQRQSPTAKATALAASGSVNGSTQRFPRRVRSSSSDRVLRKVRGRRAESAELIDDDESDSDEDEDPFRLWIEHVAIFIVGDNTVISVKNEDGSAIWQELTRRLAVPYSKLRHNNANFLVYAALDVIVDQVTSVVDTISDNLMELEDELEEQKHKFDVARLRFLKNELFRLPRLLKPAREVLKNLIESRDFDNAVTAYVRDVHDHVVQVLDDIELHLQMCRLLSEDYREARANQMNYVIYTLTIVTTVFLPAQFLTGVYGMNFDNMPELHERYGYAFFWIFVISIGATLQLYFRYKKWI